MHSHFSAVVFRCTSMPVHYSVSIAATLGKVDFAVVLSRFLDWTSNNTGHCLTAVLVVSIQWSGFCCCGCVIIIDE